MLLASKPTIVRQAAAAAGPEEDKIRKFATAIVEFSKVRASQCVMQGSTPRRLKNNKWFATIFLEFRQ